MLETTSDTPSSAELGERYIQSEIEIARRQREIRNIKDQIARLATQQMHLNDRTEKLSQLEDHIKNLEQQRGDIKPLALGERIDHEERIMRAKKERELAIEELRNDYHVNPSGVPEKWREIDQKRSQLLAEREQLPDVKELQKRQQEIGRQYQAARQRETGEKSTASDQSGKNESRVEPKKSQSAERKPDKSMSLADRMAIAKAENQLKRLAEPEKAKNQQKEHGQDRARR